MNVKCEFEIKTTTIKIVKAIHFAVSSANCEGIWSLLNTCTETEAITGFFVNFLKQLLFDKLCIFCCSFVQINTTPFHWVKSTAGNPGNSYSEISARYSVQLHKSLLTCSKILKKLKNSKKKIEIVINLQLFNSRQNYNLLELSSFAASVKRPIIWWKSKRFGSRF